MAEDTNNDWLVIRDLFDDLIDATPAEQARRLASRKVPPHIVARVRSLLDAASSDGILDKAAPVLAPATAEGSYSSLSAGQIVGAFTIDRLIGRGGMGEVYLAHRTAHDFDQRVALKMLRAEAADRSELFERERRMLARLEHPGIARLIDGGIAPDGRPYMAMEYVDGVPVDQWCRDRGAGLDQRLALFCDVCEAVAYAHANLVVHRDLKPSNILIDGVGKVRLLDFGVAKLLDDVATVPATTQALLTPDYAAPEQLAGDASTVATDVYALGVILFELVVGHGPWRREAISVPSLIQRILREDPPLPSEAAGKIDAPVPPGKLTGDIDAIAMKAMRRDPAQRYRSVGDLADDIRRHRELRPVRARGDSRYYRVGRFVRRYKWAVGASAAMIAAILIGAGGIAWQARQTAIERDVALAEARRSEAINRMLTVMFRDTGESKAGADATVKQMLDQTAARLAGSLDTSARSATLVATLSDLYVNLEDPAGADALLRQALARGIGKGDPVSTAQIKMRLASSAAALNKTDEMAPLLDAADAVFRTDPERFRMERLEVNSARAQLARRQGDYDTAIGLLTRSMPEAERVYAENHRDLLTFYNNLLVYTVEANRLDAMPAIAAQAEAAVARTGQQQTAQGLQIIQFRGLYHVKRGEYAAAERVFDGVVTTRRKLFGKSAGMAVDLLQLGRVKLALGKYADALRLLSEARPLAEQYLGPSAVPTLVIGMSLAEAMAETGDTAAADRMLDRMEPLVKATAKPGVPHAILARARAIALLKQGRTAEARAEVDRAEAIVKGLGPAGESYLKGLAPLRARIAKAS